MERIREIPVERIVDFEVEKIVIIPQEEIETRYVEVEKRRDVPIQRIIENQIGALRAITQVHEQYVEVNVTELADFKRKHPVIHQILETDVRIHEQHKVVEVPRYETNIIKNVINVPVYKFHEQIEEVIIPKEIVITNEVPTYAHNQSNTVIRVAVENRVDRPYDVIHETPVFRENVILNTIHQTNEVIVDEPFTTQVHHDVAEFGVTGQEHTVVNLVPINTFSIHTENRQMRVPYFTGVPLNEVGLTAFNVAAGAPVNKPVGINLQEVEHVVTTERPQAQQIAIAIRVPRIQRVEIDNVIEVEVPCEITIEQPVAIEKIIEVAVEKVIEEAEYVEQVVEISVPYDVIVEREVEVIKKVVIDRPVEKIIEVPVLTIIQTPVVDQQFFETDINVTTVEITPVEGGEVDLGFFEVNNEELAARIIEMKEEINSVIGENRSLQTQYRTTAFNPRSIIAVNESIKRISIQTAALHELENRQHILEQDTSRLQDILASGQIQHSYNVSYTVPHPQTVALGAELQKLVEENNRLVSSIRLRSKQR